MSASNLTPPAQPAASEPIWAKPAVSIYALTIFAGALGIAYWAKDPATLQLMIGATITMATQVVSYYLGSSSGSDKKTAMLTGAPVAPATPPPPEGH